MQGGKRQRGGATGNERYFGVDTPVRSGPPALSSAATPEYIRPPMVQQGGFGAAIMGPFANTAAHILPFAVAATGYKTYQSYKNSKNSKNSKKSRKSKKGKTRSRR